MNGLAPMPGIPESALDGIPPAEDQPTLAHRRRYAQALACALAGEKGYELTVWDRATTPVLMMLRAQQEDWPAVGTSSIVTLIQPDSPAELFMRALAQVPEPMRLAAVEEAFAAAVAMDSSLGGGR